MAKTTCDANTQGPRAAGRLGARRRARQGASRRRRHDRHAISASRRDSKPPARTAGASRVARLGSRARRSRIGPHWPRFHEADGRRDLHGLERTRREPSAGAPPAAHLAARRPRSRPSRRARREPGMSTMPATSVMSASAANASKREPSLPSRTASRNPPASIVRGAPHCRRIMQETPCVAAAKRMNERARRLSARVRRRECVTLTASPATLKIRRGTRSCSIHPQPRACAFASPARCARRSAR
ncbi:hypothetical protein X883_1505 [Burkholderia pseudomallei MSHR4304]|nr:hypothetical protein X883_1505 [Burkholderia pseudomallei MSHR4304]